jgi:ribosome recycling factor
MPEIDDLAESTEERMIGALDAFEQALAGFRTGKASPALVEGIMVEYYGAQTRLRELANISTPEPRMLVVQPFDPTSIGSIEKAIIAANIGISPVSDGRVVRLPVPELSEERRRDLAKQVSKRAEEARVQIRGIRRESNDFAKKAEKASDITQDDLKELQEEVQELTNNYTKQADDRAAAKEKELLEV